MITFFQCVAEAVAVRGFKSLAAEIPLGNFLVEVASEAWKRLKDRKHQAALRAEVEKAAQAAADEVKRAAAAAAKAALPNDPARALELELYLTQIPAAVRQSLRRPADPTGRTAPAAFALSHPEDLLPLLPARVSRFRPGSPLPGRDGWQLVELLGTGGFGEVWLARHPQFASLRRAVKFCTDLTDRDRVLLHEGGIIDRVMQAGPVPHTVPLIDADLAGPTPWLMYEYVPGGDLVALAAGWGRLSPGDRFHRAVGAVRQIATAVAHFHRLGVVHRDLKPANVLVGGGAGARSAGEAELKVADFGIGGLAARKELEAGARETSSAARLATVARGAYTPTYAPPQQKKGLSPDPRDDVFALGVIGYQLLVGDVTAERPGGKGWRRDLQKQGVLPGVLDLLESCWDDDPAERPRNAGDLLARLSAAFTPRADEHLPFAEEESVKPPRRRPTPPPPAPPPRPAPVQYHQPSPRPAAPPQPPQQGGAAGVLGFLILLALGIGGVYLYGEEQKKKKAQSVAQTGPTTIGKGPTDTTDTSAGPDAPEKLKAWALSERLEGEWYVVSSTKEKEEKAGRVSFSSYRADRLYDTYPDKIGGSASLPSHGELVHGEYWPHPTDGQPGLTFSYTDETGTVRLPSFKVHEAGPNEVRLTPSVWDEKEKRGFGVTSFTLYRVQSKGAVEASQLFAGTWSDAATGTEYTFRTDRTARRGGAEGVWRPWDDGSKLLQVQTREGKLIPVRRYRYEVVSPDHLRVKLVYDSTANNPGGAELNGPSSDWYRSGGSKADGYKTEPKTDGGKTEKTDPGRYSREKEKYEPKPEETKKGEWK